MSNRLSVFLNADTRSMLRGLIAFGAAEASVRVVRLVTVILIARQLAPEIVGQAALTLTLFELIRVLANIGVGHKIVAAPDADLEATCNTARAIFWIWCAAVAIFQLAASAVVAFMFDQPQAGAMLAALSLVYVFMPGGLVQCYLLMREGRAAATARTAAIQTISDHLLTAALLILWPNPWSIVLPKLLTAPLWLVLTRQARPWRTIPEAGRVEYAALLNFGASVLAADFLLAVRSQSDKLIIASMFGVTSLGTYFFAFNAGVGVISSLIAAFGTVVFPTLCAVPAGRARARRLAHALALGLAIFIPAIAAQSGLATLYVPLVFGENWTHAAPLIAILCLGGIPMLLSTAATAWLRAEARPHIDAFAQLASTGLALSGLYVGGQLGGLEGAATGWVLGLGVAAIPFAISSIKQPVRQSFQFTSKRACA